MVTLPDGSGLKTLIEAHRPESRTGKQDADLYLYRYGKNPGVGGEVHQLTHASYTGRSMPLGTAPTSGIVASALAQMMELTAESGLTGLLTEDHLKSFNHIETIMVGAEKKNSD